MKVFISVSSHLDINRDFIDDVKEISEFVAGDGYDLVIGAAMEEGMSGVVLKNFKDYNRKIYLKTMECYGEDPKKFNYVDFEYCEDTFMRTKRIYEDSDLLLFMPGGTGTSAEMFSFLEQLRTDNSQKKIIIYNKDNNYQNFNEAIRIFVEEHICDSKNEVISFFRCYK